MNDIARKKVDMKVHTLPVISLCALLLLNSLAYAEEDANPTPLAASVKIEKKTLKPEALGIPLRYTSVPTETYADALKVELSIVNDPKLVGQYFDSKMWRKRFVPFYLTLENTGQYPLEVSTGNILLLEERNPELKASAKMTQLASTKPTGKKSKKQKQQELPPFVVPTPPGVTFNKSKHIQYGWKRNLGMLAFTGLTFGFAAPVTVPAMVMGNMHRSTNKRLASNLQDQNLARVTVEPGDRISTWLFYRRDRKKQTLLPKKIVFADIYTPSKEELSSFVIDLQPLATDQTAVRRKLEESEVKDLQLFQGKIIAEGKDEAATEKMKSMESLIEEKDERK